MLGLIDLEHLGGKILGVAVLEFLDGVDAGGLEQFGELRAYAVDAEEVGVVDPGKDAGVVDAGRLFERLAAFGILAFLKQLIYGDDTCSNEFLCVHGADALNVDDFISHNGKN